MYPLIENNCEKLLNYLENKFDEKELTENGLEAKQLCAKFTMENVTSCAFGLEGQIFEDDSEFESIGKKIFNPNFSMAIRHLILFIEPALSPFMNVKYFSNFNFLVTPNLTMFIPDFSQTTLQNDLEKS